MDTKQRIAELAQERNWSNYELAKRSGVQLSTIQNMYHRNYEPTIPTLRALCKAFGISLSQFFADGELADVTRGAAGNPLLVEQAQRRAEMNCPRVNGKHDIIKK